MDELVFHNFLNYYWVNCNLTYFTLISILTAAFAVKVVYTKKREKVSITSECTEEILRSFNPDPLVPDNSVPLLFEKKIVQSRAGKYVTVDGIECLNLATQNFLGFADDAEITKNAADSISQYGVGSCGPRGFYGTADVHMTLEDKLAEFMRVEEACIYSYGFSTSASAIPAYCKRKDVIFADEAVNFAIQKGFDAARSRVIYFHHNDMGHLETLLKAEEKNDRGLIKKTRRFLVVEGLYQNTGTICPLPELVKLRSKYELRMFLDETISIGTIGATGRGVVEYFNVPPEEVDLRIGSMEGALASVGGFVCGTSFIVEHQRLNGLGYCFSASLPPLLAVAALTALDHLRKDPILIKTLNDVSCKVQSELSNLPNFEVRCHELSPIKHLYLKQSNGFDVDIKVLRKISDRCFSQGLAIMPAAYLLDAENFKPDASLRLFVNPLLNSEDIKFIMTVLGKVS